MEWNANLYQDKHSFVSAYGMALLEYVPDEPTQVILDLGCGTGDLTKELCKKSTHVIGLDSSEEMIEKAKLLNPEPAFIVKDACNLGWENYFDIIFSNAVFHWIPDQKTLLREIHLALKNGGRLICEFGAKDNIKSVRNAFKTVLAKKGRPFTTNFFFPSAEEYKSLLEETGFQVDVIMDYDRPTPLSDGDNGLRNWLKQFFAKDLQTLSQREQEQIFAEVEAVLKPHLWDNSKWTADYRRLRVIASK